MLPVFRSLMTHVVTARRATACCAACCVLHAIRCVLRPAHLLMAALHTAVALIQVHHIAVRVCNDLDLNVAWLLHILLHKHAAIAKGSFGLGGGAREQVNHLKVCTAAVDTPWTAVSHAWQQGANLFTPQSHTSCCRPITHQAFGLKAVCLLSAQARAATTSAILGLD